MSTVITPDRDGPTGTERKCRGECGQWKPLDSDHFHIKDRWRGGEWPPHTEGFELRL